MSDTLPLWPRCCAAPSPFSLCNPTANPDLDMDGSDDIDDDKKKNSTGRVMVHSGFFRAYNDSALKPGVRQAVRELLDRVRPPAHVGCQAGPTCLTLRCTCILRSTPRRTSS